jgi:hypothetical protein
MEVINELLNISSFFTCVGKVDVPIAGSLCREEMDIVLECNIRPEMYRSMEWDGLTIYGRIRDTYVTLLDASSHFVTTSVLENDQFCHMVIKPLKIVIGKKYPGDIFVSRMTARLNALAWMFSERLLRVDIPHNYDRIPVNFIKPKVLEAVDDDGVIKIEVAVGIGYGSGNTKIEVFTMPVIDYTFNKPTKLNQAVAKIACARNLFSFLADHNIPLENISFTDGSSEYCDCSIYLNHADDTAMLERPFLIHSDKITDIFDSIWKRWISFYRESYHIPVLYYEIVSNRSFGINRLLNLAQAIELYSVRYRDEEAWAISGKNKRRERSKLELKFRIKDIIIWLKEIFEMEGPGAEYFAKTISDYRNFYTHYNTNNYSEPSFQQIYSAGRILQFILLAVVYKTIGITDEHISDIKKDFSYGSFSSDMEVVMKDTSTY